MTTNKNGGPCECESEFSGFKAEDEEILDETDDITDNIPLHDLASNMQATANTQTPQNRKKDGGIMVDGWSRRIMVLLL